MRRVALLTALFGATAASGCAAEDIPVRGRFVEDGVSVEASGAWTGEGILIDNAGVTLEGSVVVGAERGLERVRAVARIVSLANTNDKQSADRAVTDAKATFTVVTQLASPLTTVRCGQGQSHGSAAGKDAGCEVLSVAVPAGLPERPLSVTARSGKGQLVLGLEDATLGELEAHASEGSIVANLTATAGASILVVAETGDEVVVRLPQDFAADVITLETEGGVDTAAFPEVVSGKGRGEPGRGAKSLTVRSLRTGAAAGLIRLVAR